MFDSADVEAEVVLVGRSNVGKSTLMAELTGHDVERGRRPGVTREPNQYDWTDRGGFAVTDLPGFGFMEGVDERQRERIKDEIVAYLETHADRILAAVHVVDAGAFIEIVERWRGRGEVPHDLDLHGLLADLGIPTIVAANKIDKVDDRDATLDAIGDELGYPPPWTQWRDAIAPTDAKSGNVAALREALEAVFDDAGRPELTGRIA